MTANPRAMRRATREITDPAALHALVEACMTVRVATADDEGLFIVPLSFGYDWDDAQASGERHETPAGKELASAGRLTLWVHSAREGRKVDAFDRSPQVAIEMDCEDGVIPGETACACSFAYRSLMGTGRIVREDDPARAQHGLARLMEHLAPGTPRAFSAEVLTRTNVYRIEVERCTGKERRA